MNSAPRPKMKASFMTQHSPHHKTTYDRQGQAMLPVPLPAALQPGTNPINPDSMAPPKPRFCRFSAAKLKTQYLAGKISRGDLIADGVAAQEYHTDPASAEYAIVRYRLLTATHHMRGNSGAVAAWALTQFGEDVETEGLSWGELDYGIHQWRRRSTSFAPTFGQLLGVIEKGKSERGGPGRAYARAYQTRIKKALGVEEKTAATSAPKEPANILRRRLSPQGLRAAIARLEGMLAEWEAEKQAGFRIEDDGRKIEWSPMSDILLKSLGRQIATLRERQEMFQRGEDPYANNPIFAGTRVSAAAGIEDVSGYG